MSLVRNRSLGVLATLMTLAAWKAHALGDYTQTVPLRLPKGVNGTQPELALSYSSGAGNGMVGVGWQLTGLPVITRVGYGDGIRYAATDTYAHSQLGVLVKQGDGSYRSKTESFVKLVPSGACGDGPCYWTAYHPSGVQSLYGTTSDSALLAQRGASVRTWGISKVVDTFGNFYEVAYVNDALLGLIYPSRVTYNKAANIAASGNRTVEFLYELTRTDTEPGYYQNAYQEMKKRLKSVNVKSGGLLVRSYLLAYECGDNNSLNCPGSVTNRSRLKSVTETGTDGASPLTTVTYTYQAGSAGSTSALGFSSPVTLAYQDASNPNGWDQGVRQIDLNGDGRTDLIQGYYSYGTTYTSAWLSTGIGSSKGSGWTQSVAYELQLPWRPSQDEMAALPALGMADSVLST